MSLEDIANRTQAITDAIRNEVVPLVQLVDAKVTTTKQVIEELREIFKNGGDTSVVEAKLAELETAFGDIRTALNALPDKVDAISVDDPAVP